jgi:predicted CxxxxCH...CXXCH cytochrome family protein
MTKPTVGHDNGSIDTTAAHGYNANPDLGGAFDTCSTASCHNDGRNSGLTGIWGTSINNCAECHATAPATGSHTTHLGLYACATCHTGATQGTTAGTGHRDGNITTAATTGLGVKTIGTAFTSCGTNNCHGSGSPVWGTDLSANNQCTQCHGQLVAGPATDAQKAPGGAGVDTNGDSAATDAQVGAHQVHLNPTISAAIACPACHIVPATIPAAGHIDSALPAELTWSGIATANSTTPTSCATTYCHDGAAIKNGWDGGTLDPIWIDTNFIQGASADCDNCHGYPPAGGHVANSDCNLCHDGLNADDVTFTAVGKLAHVNGTVEASGGDSCIDCHSTLSAAHDKHTDEATILGTAKLSVEGYSGLGNWYTAAYVSGKPNFGCGLCHPYSNAAHMTGGPNVNLAWDDTNATGSLKANNGDAAAYAGAGGACNQVYCHSDGKATASRVYGWGASPNWSGGTLSGNCNECHGNSPTSNAHSLHAVGIHYDTLTAAGANGLMPASGISGSGAAHGDAATADIIGCQSCHNSTVSVEYNSGNSVCVTCHYSVPGTPATGEPATGNELTLINIAGSTHVNGQADVTFANFAGFKSKAQVRNDITSVPELTGSWARYNTAGLDNTAYKKVNSFDQAKNATPNYNSALMSCSTVDCHNGYPSDWDAQGDIDAGTYVSDCMACHKQMPQ